MGILLFLVGVSLRWHQETRLASHIVYSLDFIFWSVRLLDLFALNQHAGPYLTMITKMVCNFNVLVNRSSYNIYHVFLKKLRIKRSFITLRCISQ